MENELKKAVTPIDNCEEMYLSTASCLPRRLSLDGPLRFVTSHSRFALVSMQNHAENETPEEEATVLEHMSEVSCEYIPPKQLLSLPVAEENWGFIRKLPQRRENHVNFVVMFKWNLLEVPT